MGKRSKHNFTFYLSENNNSKKPASVININTDDKTIQDIAGPVDTTPQGPASQVKVEASGQQDSHRSLDYVSKDNTSDNVPYKDTDLPKIINPIEYKQVSEQDDSARNEGIEKLVGQVQIDDVKEQTFGKNESFTTKKA